MSDVLVFNVTTVPDIAGLRVLYGLPPVLSDFEVGEYALQRRRAAGSNALPAHLQRVATISCAVHDARAFKMWSFDGLESGEAVILQGFADLLAQHAPRQVVSWQGERHAVPVLRLRALIHAVGIPMIGGPAHLDLARTLFGPDNAGEASLDQLSRLAGFPGAPERNSDEIWEAWQRGSFSAVREQSDVLAVSIYLLHLRWLRIQGELDRSGFQIGCQAVRTALGNEASPHWRTFLDAWPML